MDDLEVEMPLYQQLEIGDHFNEGDKAEILVDEETKMMIEDPNSLFRLTLSKYPKQQVVFHGRLMLKREVLSSNRQKHSRLPFDAKTVRRDKNFNFETSSKLLVSNIKQLDNQGRVAISSGFQRSNA